MTAQKSAGLLVYRKKLGSAEFLLVHPGGPFWKNKDDGAWSVPKGLIDEGEESAAAAAREFEEEVGQPISGQFIELKPLKQKSGKLVLCWMIEADLDLSSFKSNEFTMEWPPKSGRMASFPECDKAIYFSASMAMKKVLPGQQGFILETLDKLGLPPPATTAPENKEKTQGSLFD